MSPQKPPLTPADHIARANAERAAGDNTAAQTHALIAIAELLERSTSLGLMIDARSRRRYHRSAWSRR